MTQTNQATEEGHSVSNENNTLVVKKDALDEENLTQALQEGGFRVLDLKMIAKSSNKIYLAKTDSGLQIVKIPIFKPGDKLSPFWNQLNEIFGLTTKSKFEQQPELSQILSNISPLPFTIPEVRKHGSYFIMDYVNGASIEADEFPLNDLVGDQIGKYIRAAHALNYQGYGILSHPVRDRSFFLDTLAKTMSNTIREFWNNDKELHILLDQVVSKFSISGNFSLIMPDISANQFVYTSDKHQEISGLVDLDSYVIGPVEMELVVLEYVLAGSQSFLKSYGYIPGMLDGSRMLFRLYMYLCDPDSGKSWEQFNSQATFENITINK